jgi:RNA polymerase sigma-70 factor (ECF subfamily)
MAPDAGSGESDEALLVRYARGDQTAARALTLRHAPRALSLARRMLGDPAEAEDVAQEAMLRLWRIAPDWRAGEAKVSTWLYRVTVNLCTDRLRRNRARMVPMEDAPEPEDEAPTAQDGLEAGERMRALTEAIAGLPERQREAVRLRHLDGLSNIEIAELLGTSVEAVESLLARARRTLAQVLESRRAGLGLG